MPKRILRKPMYWLIWTEPPRPRFLSAFDLNVFVENKIYSEHAYYAKRLQPL